MKTINVEISEWHLAMLVSMEKTTEHTRRSLLEIVIIKMHNDFINNIREGQKLEKEGNAYLQEFNTYNIDNWKGADLADCNKPINKISSAIGFKKPDKDYWSRDHSLPYYPEESINSQEGNGLNPRKE